MSLSSPTAESPIFKTGPHAGKTAEWVMFNDPRHIYSLTNNLIPSSEYGAIGKRVEELGELGKHLKFSRPCAECSMRPVTRILLFPKYEDRITKAYVVCDNCNPNPQELCTVCDISFFPREAMRSKAEAKILVSAIKRAWFGPRHPPLDDQATIVNILKPGLYFWDY